MSAYNKLLVDVDFSDDDTGFPMELPSAPVVAPPNSPAVNVTQGSPWFSTRKGLSSEDDRNTRATKYNYVVQVMQARSQPRAQKKQSKLPQAPASARLPPPKTAQDMAVAREQRKRDNAAKKERKRAQQKAAEARELGPNRRVQLMPMTIDEDVEMECGSIKEGPSTVEPMPSTTSNVDVEMNGDTAGKESLD